MYFQPKTMAAQADSHWFEHYATPRNLIEAIRILSMFCYADLQATIMEGQIRPRNPEIGTSIPLTTHSPTRI